MLWRWPGHLAAGLVAEEIVESVDFANTGCALAGLAPMETTDGRDISSLLQGDRGEMHRIGCYDSAQAVTPYHHAVNADGKTHFGRIRTLRGGNYI